MYGVFVVFVGLFRLLRGEHYVDIAHLHVLGATSLDRFRFEVGYATV